MLLYKSFILCLSLESDNCFMLDPKSGHLGRGDISLRRIACAQAAAGVIPVFGFPKS